MGSNVYAIMFEQSRWWKIDHIWVIPLLEQEIKSQSRTKFLPSMLYIHWRLWQRVDGPFQKHRRVHHQTNCSPLAQHNQPKLNPNCCWRCTHIHVCALRILANYYTWNPSGPTYWHVHAQTCTAAGGGARSEFLPAWRPSMVWNPRTRIGTYRIGTYRIDIKKNLGMQRIKGISKKQLKLKVMVLLNSILLGQ